MSDKGFYFLFISLLWLGITSFIFYNWFESIQEEIRLKNFVRTGGCVAMDELGNCYSAKEYQDILERQGKIEVLEELKTSKGATFQIK